MIVVVIPFTLNDFISAEVIVVHLSIFNGEEKVSSSYIFIQLKVTFSQLFTPRGLMNTFCTKTPDMSFPLQSQLEKLFFLKFAVKLEA